MLGLIRKKVYSILKINKENEYKYEAIKICLIYSVIGFLWVYYSDRIATKLASDNGMLLLISTYKGLIYVIVTSVILYSLIGSLLKKVDLAEKELTESYEELTAINEELEAYVQQLAAGEEELRVQYDQIIESEKKLRKSEEKNSAIVKAIPDLLFVIDNEGYFIDCIASDESLLLMPKEAFIGRKLLEVIPKEISEVAYEKMELVLKYGMLESFEYKVEIANKAHYFELRMVKNNEKEVLAISRNVTAERQNELKLKVSENNFRNIFEWSSDAIFLADHTKIIDCNLAIVELLGCDSKACLIGKYLGDFSPEKQLDGQPSKERMLEMYKRAMESGKCKFEWWYKRGDGRILPVEVMMTTIVYNGKKVFHSVWRDISDRKQMEHKLEYLSYHDQLTGLYNRRYFEEQLKIIDDEKNYPLTIVMADVNGLKLVNDSFGHYVGDELLKKVVEVIIKGCRNEDIIARLAGDEFVILLSRTDGYEAEQIIKRIKALASKEKVGSVDISVSFGYETKNNKEEKIQDIFKKAEDHMYKKKLFESPSMRGKTINAIISTLHEKNKREEQHSLRVSRLCEEMGKVLSLTEDDIKELKTVGLLHDIGKIAIEENILNKPERLTDDEWEEIKRHPEIGYRILSTVNDMSEMAEYVLAHHERWDGKGYPKGLKGEEIPLQSRIITIADSYDAMVSDRSYRSALSEEVAIEELKSSSDSQFDSELVKIFIEKVLNRQFD